MIVIEMVVRLYRKQVLQHLNECDTPNRAVAYVGFPAKLGESIKTHISVKSRDIDTKLEL
jgi:hypothetical protein